MSRQPYGINLYPNGDHAPNNAAAYNTSYPDAGPLGMEGEHRAGGYGGFHADNNEHPNPLINGRGLQAPSDNHHRFANSGYGYPLHRPGDRSQIDRPLDSRAIERDGTQNNSTLYGTGPGGRQIQGTCLAKLKEILESLDTLGRCTLRLYRYCAWTLLFGATGVSYTFQEANGWSHVSQMFYLTSVIIGTL
ncbi:MAG: hypothetical protein L6R37_001507 [Teloschistes peruensis]|nr:MAG: hypothetical protein L6R37_001507 [Teloschistes peruensis]